MLQYLKPGQYRGSHIIRKHQGRYEALGQQNPMTVYRDNNRDNNYDLNDNNTQTGLFGINIHRATKYAGKKSSQVDKWSAGCQVIASNDDWKLFMKICRKARDKWGNSFTYTLLESNKYITFMAIVNKVNKKVKMSKDEVIKYQILTHCFLNNIQISKSDLNCLSELAKS